MTSYNHIYHGNPLYNYMEELSMQLGLPVINNSIRLPAVTGNGFIKNLFLEEGFYIRYYRFQLNENIIFQWTNEKDKYESVYKLLFNFEAANNEQDNQNVGPGSAALYSTDFVKATMIEKNRPVNRIVFLFTKKWLEENFNEAADKVITTFNYLVSKNMLSYIVEDMNMSQINFANDLVNQMSGEEFPLINIKTKALILVNSFLNEIVSPDPVSGILNQSLYYNEIVQLEKRLRDHLDKPLPKIAHLASEFNLSTGTLKRHFKIVYGNTIYKYYLEQKLALGKSMLAAKNKSISEVAYTLGYNKINSFSKAFKKQYGFLPKEMSMYLAVV